MNKTYDVVLVDHGYFAMEGFSSGLMIILREVMNELRRFGLSCAIATYEEDLHPTIYAAGFDILQRNGSALKYKDWLSNTLTAADARITITHLPAIEITDQCIIAAQVCNQIATKRLTVLADPLFPKRAEVGDALFEHYYNEIAATEVVGIGTDARALFEAETGILATKLMNPYEVERFYAPDRQADAARYVTMVNFHPLKGSALFVEIARRMPEVDFLLIKNWPDAPTPQDLPPNLEMRPFFEDPKVLYRETRLLLVPSLWREGPARVVLEALFNGIQPIIHRIGSLPEFEDCGVIYIDPPEGTRFEQKGSVLVPVVPNREQERIVTAFIETINATLAEKDPTRAAHLHAMAAAYVRQSREVLFEACLRWMDETKALETTP